MPNQCLKILSVAPIPEVARFADCIAIADGGQGVIEPSTAYEMVPLGVDIPRVLVHCGIKTTLNT